ncbi:MAG: alpha-amylase family glycosyl hydrolase, partial [Schleiferiaceae bacterium]
EPGPQPWNSLADVGDPQDLLLYEVNPRAHSAAGNLAGITADLDRLKSLHVNTIWLMPVFKMGQVKSVGSPYCVADYRAIDPEFGSLEDLQTLIAAAHERKMAVIIDWVANHTAWDHPWITQHPEWYTKNASGAITHPPGTNWQDVADLDYSQPALHAAMIDEMKYWVHEVGVDGFRYDAADYVPFAFWKSAMDSLKGITDRKLLFLTEGERADHYTAGLPLVYGWTRNYQLQQVFGTAQVPVTNLFTAHNAEATASPALRLRFATNHDQSAWDATPVTKFGGIEGAYAAQAAAVLMGGVPLIYSGQEVGVTGTQSFFAKDPVNWSANPGLSERYGALYALRVNHEVLRYGSLKPYSHPNVLVFERILDGERVLVMINTRSTPVTYNVPTALQGVEGQDLLRSEPAALGTSLALAAHEVRVVAVR